MVVNSCSVIRCNLGFLSTSTEDFTYRAGPVPVLEGQSRILGGDRSLDSKTPECFRTDWRTSAYECQSSQWLHRTSTTKEGGTAPRVSVLSEPVQTDWVTFGLLGCYWGGGGRENWNNWPDFSTEMAFVCRLSLHVLHYSSLPLNPGFCYHVLLLCVCFMTKVSVLSLHGQMLGGRKKENLDSRFFFLH